MNAATARDAPRCIRHVTNQQSRKLASAHHHSRCSMEWRTEIEPQLSHRYQTLVWTFLDADLPKTALFYAERFFVEVTTTHIARHLYAIALLRLGQTHSAFGLVANRDPCAGCLELKAQCCERLGRYRMAADSLAEAMAHPTYSAYGESSHV